MTTNDVVTRVNDLLHETFEIERAKLVPSSRLIEDLELDSLDAVDLLVHMEEKFNVRVPGERMASLKTLGDVYTMVSELNLSDAQAQFSP